MWSSTSTSPPPPSTSQTSPSAFWERPGTPADHSHHMQMAQQGFLPAGPISSQPAYCLMTSVTPLSPLPQSQSWHPSINLPIIRCQTPRFLLSLVSIIFEGGEGCYFIWVQRVHTFLGGHSPLTGPSIKALLNPNLSPLFSHNGNRPSWVHEYYWFPNNLKERPLDRKTKIFSWLSNTCFKKNMLLMRKTKQQQQQTENTTQVQIVRTLGTKC